MPFVKTNLSISIDRRDEIVSFLNNEIGDFDNQFRAREHALIVQTSNVIENSIFLNFSKALICNSTN